MVRDFPAFRKVTIPSAKAHECKILHFVVERIVSYAVTAPSAPIINTVFGPTTGHHLNLITCNGVWTGHGYDQRLVVFTTQVN
jgi:hypothetical protein